MHIYKMQQMFKYFLIVYKLTFVKLFKSRMMYFQIRIATAVWSGPLINTLFILNQKFKIVVDTTWEVIGIELR